MNKIILVWAVVVVGGTAWGQTHPRTPGGGEVIYKGRALTQWLERAKDRDKGVRREAVSAGKRLSVAQV